MDGDSGARGPREEKERLKAERERADRAYNDALTRLDAAIQKLPADFPHPPPGPDSHQMPSLNALWNIAVPESGSGLRGRIAAAVRRIVAPMFDQQRAFNSALVDHVNRNLAVQAETRQAVESTLVVLRDALAELVRFQSVLVMFAQEITPYVDTRDRDVAGLLRGLSGAIDAVSNELLKRSEALLVRDRLQDQKLGDLERSIADLRAKLAEFRTQVS